MAEQGFMQLPTTHEHKDDASGAAVKLPADQAARQQLLEKCLREAQIKAAAEASGPLWHGRIALLGLAILEGTRAMAWWDGNIPGYYVFTMHILTTTADILCGICTLPFFIGGTSGWCVRVGCVGPMMTIVFAMSVIDFGALCAYLMVATPRPLAPGDRSYVDVVEAFVGVWDFGILASVALEVALCVSCWRVYKELREHGLYPPGSSPVGIGKIEEVSLLELICEVEDVKFVSECNCQGRPKGNKVAPA